MNDDDLAQLRKDVKSTKYAMLPHATMSNSTLLALLDEVIVLRAQRAAVEALAEHPTVYFEADGSIADDAVSVTALRAALTTEETT